MGQRLHKGLNEDRLIELRNNTDFSKEEIQALYLRFNELADRKQSGRKGSKENNDKVIDKATLVQALRESNVCKDEEFALRLFSLLDPEDNGVITLSAYCTALSCFTSGKLLNTLEVIFHLFNLDGDQWITKDEMFRALLSIDRALKGLVDDLDRDMFFDNVNHIKRYVDTVFEEKTRLDFDQFATAVADHPFLKSAASIFISRVCSDYFSLGAGLGGWMPIQSTDVSGRRTSTGVQINEYGFPLVASSYQKTTLMGNGATAKVYRSTCPRFLQEKKEEHVTVATKIFDLTKCSSAQLQALGTEITQMKQMRSRYLVNILASFVDGDELWVVLPYMHGGSVTQAMKYLNPGGGFGDERIIAAIIGPVLHGLAYLHSEATIHRDVKGHNILMSATGQVMLADFGVSTTLKRVVGKELEATGFSGTVPFMAPEVINGDPYNKKVDIWSLGCTCLEFKYGISPYRGETPTRSCLNVLKDTPNPQWRTDSSLSRSFRSFLASCLTTDAAARPTATKLLQSQFLQKMRPDERGEVFLKRTILAPIEVIKLKEKNLKLSKENSQLRQRVAELEGALAAQKDK